MRQREGKTGQFQPRWRHFHPQATLYLRNPFNEDIIFQVADEHNTPYQYKMPARKISELPGGAVATLGLKEIVDRMIGESKTDAVRIWDPALRAEYESRVIVREKAPPKVSGASGPNGVVDLASEEDEDMAAAAADNGPKEEKPFAGANKPKQQEQPSDPPATSDYDTGKAELPPPPARKAQDRPKGFGSGKEPSKAAAAAAAAATAGADNQVIEED